MNMKVRSIYNSPKTSYNGLTTSYFVCQATSNPNPIDNNNTDSGNLNLAPKRLYI